MLRVDHRRNLWGGCGKRVLRVWRGELCRDCVLEYMRTNFSAGGRGRDTISLSLFGARIFYRAGTSR
jgi:hypothetical protein